LPTWGGDQRYCLALLLTEVPESVSALQAHSNEFSFVERNLFKYLIKYILRTAKFFPTRGFNQRYWSCLYLTEVSGCVFAPQAHSRLSNINFDI
jgi:hypothetical protein